MTTTVVNVYRHPFDVRITRPGPFGNPFKIGPGCTRDQCIERFREYFLERMDRDPEFAAAVLRLRGKVLGCVCKPQPCHGDVIAEFLNSVGD